MLINIEHRVMGISLRSLLPYTTSGSEYKIEVRFPHIRELISYLSSYSHRPPKLRTTDAKTFLTDKGLPINYEEELIELSDVVRELRYKEIRGFKRMVLGETITLLKELSLLANMQSVDSFLTEFSHLHRLS